MMPNGNAQSDSGACLKPSGAKLRADAESPIWVCALIDAINATRARIESGYKVAVPAARAPSRLSAAGASALRRRGACGRWAAVETTHDK